MGLNHASKRGNKNSRGATITTSATQVFRVMKCYRMGDQSSVAAPLWLDNHSSGLTFNHRNECLDTLEPEGTSRTNKGPYLCAIGWCLFNIEKNVYSVFHAIHIDKLLYVDTYISFNDMFSFMKHIR